MRVQIKAASSLTSKGEIIEVNSIDEAIKRVQTDKKLVQSVISNEYSWIADGASVSSFIVYTNLDEQDCETEIILYDYYWE